MKTLAARLASLAEAHHNCRKATPPNTEWAIKHEACFNALAKRYLPSGSGIDHGTRVFIGLCSPRALVFSLSFHHMDESGGYDGWTEHSVTARPTFTGYELSIGGRDRNNVKDYLHDVLVTALEQPIADDEYKALVASVCVITAST